MNALSNREREVVVLVARGLTSKEIANALGIGLKTVDSHRQNAMSKLGLHSAVALTRYAIREGMVAP